jgi:hypothetical protein
MGLEVRGGEKRGERIDGRSNTHTPPILGANERVMPQGIFHLVIILLSFLFYIQFIHHSDWRQGTVSCVVRYMRWQVTEGGRCK